LTELQGSEYLASVDLRHFKKVRGNMKSGIFLLTVSLLVTSVPCHAESISIFNTGVLDSGVVASVGAADLHYQRITDSGTLAPVFLTNPPNSLWLPNSSASAWIDNSGSRLLAETETYVTFFSLDGLDATTALLNINIGVDNNLIDVRLNGISLGLSLTGTTLSNFQQLNALPIINSGFVSGLNRLEFDLNNFGASNPSDGGFRLEVNGTADAAKVPEIPSAALLTIGLAGLQLVLRKRL
jgi:hypothetical protein